LRGQGITLESGQPFLRNAVSDSGDAYADYHGGEPWLQAKRRQD